MYLNQFSTPSSLSQVPVALGDSAGAAAATVAQGGGSAQGTPSSCSASHWGHSVLGWRGEEQGRWAANPQHAGLRKCAKLMGLRKAQRAGEGAAARAGGDFQLPPPPKLPGDPSHASPGFGWDPRESSGGFLLSRLAAAGKETAAPKGLKFKQKKYIYINKKIKVKIKELAGAQRPHPNSSRVPLPSAAPGKGSRCRQALKFRR